MLMGNHKAAQRRPEAMFCGFLCFRVSVARRALCVSVWSLVLALTVGLSSGRAQQMPDPSQMAGRALPAPELATGTVSVRLFRERVGNNIANHPVTLSGLKD